MFRGGSSLKRRDALKAFGALCFVPPLARGEKAFADVGSFPASYPAHAAFDRNVHETFSTPFSDFSHAALRTSPQWTYLEDGTLALWLWLKPEVRSVTLEVRSDRPEISARNFGVEEGGTIRGENVILLPFATAENLAGAGFSVKVTPRGYADSMEFSLGVPKAASSLQSGFSFLFGSCLNQIDGKGEGTMETMASVDADFNLFLGDTVYYLPFDLGSKEAMAKPWMKNRNLAGFRKMGGKRPLLALWDDHDFGPNNADASFEGRDLTRAMFLEQFPRQLNTSLQQREGIYSSTKIGNTRFILLDNRTFRDPTGRFFPAGSYLGEEQLRWFEEQVSLRDYEFLVVAGGSQFFAPNPLKETYSRHQEEFSKFRGFLREALTTPIIFMSGDIHMTEVIDLRDEFPKGAYEVTCSGLANIPGPQHQLTKRFERHAYFYDNGYTFARMRMGSSVAFDHFSRDGRLLKEMRLF